MSVKRIGSFGIKRLMKSIKSQKKNAPLILGNLAVNHFKEGFRVGGKRTDDSSSGWQKRKSTAPRNKGRAILVDSGRLKRSIRIRQRRFSKIVIGTAGVKYARRHNEGLKGMPKREFIGDSRGLNKRLRKKIKQLIKLQK